MVGLIEPGRSSGGVRKRNEIELVTGATGAEQTSDHIVEPAFSEKLFDRELAYGDDEVRAEQTDFGIEPAGAVGDLQTVRKTIRAAVGCSAGKASGDCTDMDLFAKPLFTPSDRLEPVEQTRPSRVRERAVRFDLMRTRRLSHQHRPGIRHGSRHGSPRDGRTAPAGVESPQMLIESSRFAVRGSREW